VKHNAANLVLSILWFCS